MPGSYGPPKVSVLMPTFQQERFIGRAIRSLFDQRHDNWELIIVDDGGDASKAVEPFLADPRVRYHREPVNLGLGAALNVGLDLAESGLIAYLPSDDVYYPDHLSSLVQSLAREPDSVLSYSGIRHHYNRESTGAIEGHGLQFVQVLHRGGAERWTARTEVVTDDLDAMFWSKLAQRGSFASTGEVTCEWVDHPDQLHKVIREPVGGINTYRSRFEVRHPLRFRTTAGNPIDEVSQYQSFRDRPDTPMAADGLRILLAGELAYNAERVLALEERGHRLYGLWMPEPYWYNSVGPMPFGHVTDLPRNDFRAAIRAAKPDIIYAQLNWQAVPFLHEVLAAQLDVPFVWHFKEGPFICLEKGTWPELVDLYTQADGVIYCSSEMQEWTELTIPATAEKRHTLVLDGDLPKADWFVEEQSPRLSATIPGFHTVVPGRPIGLHPETVGELADCDIHLHFYGEFTHGQWKAWIERARSLAPNHLHLHSSVDQRGWVREFSQYDAGWLHFFSSHNGGDLRRANWDDLNYPARMTSLISAGVPLLQYDNTDAHVATDRLIRSLELGLFFCDMKGLRRLLDDTEEVNRVRANVWKERSRFTFDHHADRLIAFFRQVIADRSSDRLA